MLKNHLKIAWRNILRHPGYSLLNVSGFALGIAASFVLFLFVKQETSYEKHFKDSDQIYRVASDFFNMGGFAVNSEAFYNWAKEECKEVEYATAVEGLGASTLVEFDGSNYVEGKGIAVDSNFFKVFNFDLLAGDIRQLMKNPDEVVLTEVLAKKYFGNASAIGETLLIGKEKKPYRITGVLKETDDKSQLKASFYFPIKFREDKNWLSAHVYVYLKLYNQANLAQLEQSIEALRKEKVYPAVASDLDYEAWKKSGSRVEYFIQPLESIYLHSNFRFDLTAGGNMQQVAILGIIGFFLIFIAIINYINLTTARSAIRAKEVGVKKTLGANRGTLALQFLTESILISILAMLIAGGLGEFLLTIFENITGQSIIASIFVGWQPVVGLLAFSLVAGLLAGIYPAAYLTKFQPVKVLKGKGMLSGNKGLRGSLVVFQFAIAICLIISSLVVYRQLDYMQEVDKGFEQEGILSINNIKQLGTKAKAFKERLEQFSAVKGASFNDRMPAGNSIWMHQFKTEEMEKSLNMQTFPVDEEYLPLLGFRLLKGRNFSKELATDTSAIILNQAAVAALGLAGKDPIGVEIGTKGRVIGVVQDFNFQSLKQEIEPAAMTFGAKGERLTLKISSNQTADFLSQLDGVWKEFAAEEAINYTFLDDNFAKLAAKEKMLGQAVAIFTLMAIIIACLGLFGLAAFMAEQRTKEIGIRKVLGASISGIIMLLSKDFLKLVGFAICIAMPLAYLFMSKWLQDFAYRIELEHWIFIAAGMGALLLAFLTVSLQSIRAALANPVKALMSE
jgi:putative ABC transport system permease protein